MAWLLPRLVGLLLAMALAAGLGWLLGGWLGQPLAGAWLGAAVGAGLALMHDGFRAARLLRWLRSDLSGPAPRDGGYWAELAYRIERAMRQREQALVQEERRLGEFLQAIQASPNGILLLSEGGRIAWCNGNAALQLGLDPQRDLGQHLTNLVRAPEFVAYWQSGAWQEPISFARPGGQGMLQVLLRAYGEGQTLLVSQDVTERLHTDAMRRDFVANVSHEIRSPLTVLVGFLETMRSLPLSETERQRVMLLMSQQAERMQVLVSDLLTLAQLEGSPWPDSTHWLDLGALMQRVLGDTQALSAGRHQVHLQPGPALEVAALASELLSAVGNLASNAVRYTPAGGQITLGWLLRPDGNVQVQVQDNGIGIAREHLPRLTERFYRVDGSRSRDTGGTGLGLAIVKHVAQRHGGALEVESSPGQGSCFKLVLPAVRVRAAAALSAPGVSAGTPV